MVSDRSLSTAFPYNFSKISAEFFFLAVPTPFFNAPPAPKHWKNKQIWCFWASFRIFRVFRFFLFFRSVFSVFSGALSFRIFRFSGGRVSEESVPQHRVHSSSHSSPPRPTVTQADSQTRRKTQACRLVFAAGSPQACHQCCHRCVVHQLGGQGMQWPND